MTLLHPLPASLQPLRRKLPLLIITLLCVVVGTFSWIAHHQLMRAFETAAGRNLDVAASQVEGLLKESTTLMRRQMRSLATDSSVVDVLALHGQKSPAAVEKLLAVGEPTGAAAAPGQRPLRTFWTRDCQPALSARGFQRDTALVACPTAAELKQNASRAAWLRPFTLHGDSVQFEGVTAVTRGRDTIGFIAQRFGMSGGQGVTALKALIGTDSRILIGNAVGAPVWTDLSRHVAPPTSALSRTPQQFTRTDGVAELGVAKEVSSTPWLLWVDLPMDPLLAPERDAMRRLAMLAVLSVILGAIGAWVISAQVTGPLVDLTDAADEVARGNYEMRVPTTRRDEIGSLVTSFNHMAERVELSRHQLNLKAAEIEQQFHDAQDLTQELELSNQELLETMEEAQVARRDTTVAESLLDEVMARAPVGIGVLDRDIRFVRVNPALAAINGAAVRAHIGKRPSEIVPTLVGAETRLRYALESGETVSGHRSSEILHGSARSHFLSSYFPVRGADHEVVGVGVIVVDTTAHHDLEVQLLQAQKMDAVGRLAGGVAHDFNNLLTVITSYSSMALDSLAIEDPLHEDMNEVLAAAQRATGLTRQLLAFSRKQVLQPTIVNLNEVATDMQRMLSRLIGEDIALTLDLQPDVGDVSADRGQIEQVIMNLAINARDAMPDGGDLVIATSNGNITTEFSISDLDAHAGEYVTLTVTDSGTGMSDDTQAHLFEPFFTTKPVGKGTGLGLATVYGVVKQSGGDIRVRSATGEGTSFTICLPRVRAVEPTSRRPSSDTDAHAGGSETLLLVEDDAALRSLARRVLRRDGYTVLEAGDAHAALHISETYTGTIDLLVTDVVMPGMNGRALGEQLTARHAGMRVLYMSGYTDDDVMRRGVSAAQTTFLQKPFTPDKLSAAVRAVLASAPSADA